jgi:hypothetical protein
MEENYEAWYEEFDSLATDEKRELLNAYYDKHETLDKLYKFDDCGLEDLLGTLCNPVDIICMTYHGDIDITDDYIRFSRNGYSLETLSRSEVEREADEYAKGIFNEVNWHDKIELPINVE